MSNKECTLHAIGVTHFEGAQLFSIEVYCALSFSEYDVFGDSVSEASMPEFDLGEGLPLPPSSGVCICKKPA